MNKLVKTSGSLPEIRANDARAWVGAALLALTMAACGGGGAGGGQEGTSGGSGAVPGGNLIVTVMDPLRIPAVGAKVTVQPDGGSTIYGTTGSNGQAEIRVPAGRVMVYVSGPGFRGFGPDVTVGSRETLKVSVATHPKVDSLAGGIVGAKVVEVSPDGRAVQFSLDIMSVDGVNQYSSVSTAIQVEDCTPDAVNDTLGVQADCIVGAGGFDAPYGASRTESVETVSNAGLSFGSFDTVLLLDQGADLAINDPADQRLFAAKYLLSLTSDRGAGQQRSVLGAFSADHAGSGRFSVLPQKPVTLFPLGNPGFTSDGRSLFPIVDALATQEGGAGALLPAVDKALDFLDASADLSSPAIVVVSNGRDDTCGSTADCRRLRDAVVARADARGVRIVTIGLARDGSAADHETMNLLAQTRYAGASLWLDDPAQFGMAMVDVHSYLGDFKPFVRATFRIESPTAGAFAPGRTVLGKVRFEHCPWDCFEAAVPFAVKIP